MYAILNVEDEDRYYITSISRVDNDELSDVTPANIYINPFQQECFLYFVLRAKYDVEFNL